MNGKKAKALRNQVKNALNVESITAEYDQEVLEVPVRSGRFDDKGEELILNQITLLQTLVQGCPRQVYKQFKKEVKQLDQAA